jgi:transcriptional regulator with XRE-family HTH domain
MQKRPANKGVKRLRRWMQDNDKSQYDLSLMLDVSPEHLCRLIAGRFKPGLTLAVKFEEACNIPCRSWLERI